jgi:hypothetical protein
MTDQGTSLSKYALRYFYSLEHKSVIRELQDLIKDGALKMVLKVLKNKSVLMYVHWMF